MKQSITVQQPAFGARLLLFLLLWGPLGAWAQTQTPTTIAPISLGAAAYTQNFNTLAASSTSSTVPAGFGFSETNVGTGTSANNTYTAVTVTASSSPSTGDTYSFGFGSTTTTDRAFGSVRSGSLAAQFGFAFTNNTGSTITSLSVGYTGELYRLAGSSTPRNASDRLDFQYSLNATSLNAGTFVDVDALDYVGPVNTNTSSTGYDGNATANRAAISGTITGLNIADGATFYIRWNDFDAPGADDALAIDDFTITATTAAPCNAPTGLGTANITSTTADVTFTGSASATGGYTVTTSPASATQTGAAGATSVGLSGLTPNTAYTASIVSNCAGGAVSSAATVTFTTSAASTPCDAPTALGVSAVTNSTATVSFTGSATATGGYTLTTTPATSSQTLPAGATLANLTGLTAGTAYTVNIVSNCGAGGASSPATATFTTTSVCAAPTGLAAANVTTTSADVTFTGSGSATGYTVTTSPTTTTQTLPANATSVSFVSLTPGTAYTVSIVSNCAGGATATAATTTFTTATPPVPSISIAAVNTAYSENFNTLATAGSANAIGTLPLGWTFDEADTNANTNYRADDGGSATGDTFSYGTGTTTDRALGTLASGSLQSTIGAAYTNNTGVPITSLLINYTGELWRLAVLSGRLDRLDFSYSTGGGTFTTATYTPFSALNFSTPATADLTAAVGARNGNAAANQTAVTGTISGLNIAPGATFFIRWVDPDITGNDDGLAIDNFSLTANPVVPCGAPTIAGVSTAPTTASVTLTPGPDGGTTFTVTATPAGGGTPVTATGTSPVSLTGLTPGTSYSVTATSTCNAGFSSPSATSAATPLTTPAAPTASLFVRRNNVGYPNNGAAYDFGNQTLATSSAPVSFTLANNGTGALTISSITTTGNFAVSGPPPTTVAAGDTAVVSVTFTPTALGARTGTLVINSNASNAAAYTVNLTGTGTAVPTPEIDVQQTSTGTSYASGSTFSGFPTTTVGSFSPVAFTVLNTGTAPLTISSTVPSGDFSIASSGNPPYVIPGGGSLALSFIFGPTAPGTRTGSVTLTNNDADEATYVINLSGNATAATLPNLTVTTGTPLAPTPIAGNYNDVTIAPGGYAALAGPLTVAGTLTIQNGGGLAQGGLGQACQPLTGTGSFVLQADGTLAICDPLGISPTGVPTGAVLLTGTRTYSPLANYIYTGNAAQVTGTGLPSTVQALGVQNVAGVTLSQALSLTQGLNLGLGNLITNGRTFTLLSSAAGTAGVVNGGGVVVGTATVQRYINSANAIGYRHYSAPVSNTTFGDLATTGFSPVFNVIYNSSPTPSTLTTFPTVFGYDQSRIATVNSNYGSFDKGWFSPSGPTDAMVVGKGYTVNAPNTALVDFVGTLNNGAQNSGVLARGTDAAAGWHLLGNPYPSPLDWNTVTPAQRPGMDAAIYVFESAGQYGGSYRASVNGVGGNANSSQPIVVAGQGYFVRVSAGQTSGQVNLTNLNRVNTFGPQPSFGRGTTDIRPQVALTLQGASVADAAYVYFEAGATAGKDVEFDATKLPNSHGLNLSSLAGGEALAINGLPALGAATVLVPLHVAAPQAGSYSLTASSVANFTGTVTLIDGLTGTRTALSTGSRYAFALASPTAAGRFTLEVGPAAAPLATAAQVLAAQVQLFPNPASGAFRLQLPVLSSKVAVPATLVNALGQTVRSRTLSAPAGQALDAEFDVRGLAAGVYTLRLSLDGTPVVRKVVVQ
ncbi:fibronectin type III domain-containing protein [Hymenobacter ruricola]|uniref:Fibronectin type III domain-containing protein n=1 Tax=Hymenobacter ruricola TaxID=2791023 RepID=A0ABS0I505_9BACT|nr:fibronectin type III domain-containing protein [Hymenobacter ruricola]MBF9222030.1 fibronectin type III domain-containing protein [Hymenobacter ruricola]